VANGLVNAVPATVVVQCTNGEGDTLAGDNGLHALLGVPNLSNGASSIPYTYTISAADVAAALPGDGTANSINIGGVIAAGTYGTATAGVYSDTITITLTY
jgi:spore coat protein U-like protein